MPFPVQSDAEERVKRLQNVKLTIVHNRASYIESKGDEPKARGVILNHDGLKTARRLIESGKLVRPEKWVEPDSETEDRFIRRHGMREFGKWHVARDTKVSEDSKHHWKFILTTDFKTLDIRSLSFVAAWAANGKHEHIKKQVQLLLKDAKQKLSEMEDTQALDDDLLNCKRWDAFMPIETPDSKKFKVVKGEDGDVVDYKDVQIRGYLSTFQDTTPSDRQGDYVIPGAFDETIEQFMMNPVLLRDHVNMTTHLSGVFTKLKEDRRGLYVEANLSNSPDVRDVRFKVAEGILRTLSMGGVWFYKEDGRGIFKATLFEGSLTPIPANPDALFQVRSLTDDEKKFVKSGGLEGSFSTFLPMRHLQNLSGVAA